MSSEFQQKTKLAADLLANQANLSLLETLGVSFKAKHYFTLFVLSKPNNYQNLFLQRIQNGRNEYLSVNHRKKLNKLTLTLQNLDDGEKNQYSNFAVVY